MGLMSLSAFNLSQTAYPARVLLHPVRLLRALLIGVLPGIMLLCIGHCAWHPQRAVAIHYGHTSSDTTGEVELLCHFGGGTLPVPSPLDYRLLQALSQAWLLPTGPLLLPLALLVLMIIRPVCARTRLAEPPPMPPPRLGLMLADLTGL